MIGFLNNAWTIGIGGGILSGIIVTLITRFIFSRKDNGVYIQNLRLANNEVIYALKPTISENYFPDVQVINALCEANSRKFKVNRLDMYTIKQIAEELTKEIMDTSFISYEKKEELFKHLIELYSHRKETGESKNKEYNEEYLAYRRRLLNASTSIIGVMASMVTFFVFLYPELSSSFDIVIDNPLERMLILFFGTIIMISALILAQLYLRQVRRIRERGKRLKREVEESFHQ